MSKSLKKIGLAIASVIFVVACFALTFSFGKSKVAAAETYDVENRVMYLLASVGNKYSVTYFETSENVSLTFDYVLDIKGGYFGLFFGQGGAYSDSTCFMTGVNGEKAGVPYSGNFRFERGYSYKAAFDNDGKTVSVYRKAYTADNGGYALACVLDFPSAYSSVGVMVKSDSAEQACAYVDNFGIKTQSLTQNFVNTFNGTTGVTAYGIKVASNGGNITANYGIPSSYYVAKFMSSDMTVLSSQKVAVFNYATAPQAPEVSGMEFIGWSIDYTAAAYTDTTDAVVIIPVYKEAGSVDETVYGATEYDVSLLSVSGNNRSVLINANAPVGRYVYIQYTVASSSLSTYFGFSGVGSTDNSSVTYFSQNGYMKYRNFEQSLFSVGSTYRLIFDTQASSFTYRAYKVTGDGLVAVVSDFNEVGGTYKANSKYAGITVGINSTDEKIELSDVKCYDDLGNDLGIKTTGPSVKRVLSSGQTYLLSGHTFAIYNKEAYSSGTHVMLEFTIGKNTDISFGNTLVGWFGNSEVTSQYGYNSTYGYLARDDGQKVSAQIKAGDKVKIVVEAGTSSTNGAIYINNVAQSFSVTMAKASSDVTKCKYFGLQIMNKTSSSATAFCGSIENVRSYAYFSNTGLQNDLGVEIKGGGGFTVGEQAISMKQGATIRLASPMGIGFMTKVDKATYINILNTLGNVNSVVTGTIILPTAYLTEDSEITHAYLDENGIKYKDVVNKGWLTETDSDYYFRGSLIVAERNYSNAFSAVGYLGFTVNGKTHYIYTQYSETDNSRATDYIAGVTLADLSDVETAKYCFYVDDGTYKGYSPYTPAQRAEMAKYLG